MKVTDPALRNLLLSAAVAAAGATLLADRAEGVAYFLLGWALLVLVLTAGEAIVGAVRALRDAGHEDDQDDEDDLPDASWWEQVDALTFRKVTNVRDRGPALAREDGLVELERIAFHPDSPAARLHAREFARTNLHGRPRIVHTRERGR